MCLRGTACRAQIAVRRPPYTNITVQPTQCAYMGTSCSVVPGTEVCRQRTSEAALITSSTSSAIATCSTQDQVVNVAKDCYLATSRCSLAASHCGMASDATWQKQTVGRADEQNP